MGQHIHELSITEDYATDFVTGVRHLVYVEADIEVTLPGLAVVPFQAETVMRALRCRELNLLANGSGIGIELAVALTDEERNAYLALRASIMGRVLAALGVKGEYGPEE